MSKRNMIDRVRGVLGVQHREPQVETPGPAPIEERGAHEPAASAEPASHFWPADEPMPTEYRKPPARRRVPCPKCRRLYLPNGSQAVVLRTVGLANAEGRKALFRCRACGHHFQRLVEEETR